MQFSHGQYNMMNKTFKNTVSVILIVIAGVVILFGNLFPNKIGAIAFAITAVVIVLLIPVFLIREYRNKVKRLGNLEHKLPDQTTPYDSED
jgi:uncharacterized membrane protein YoaK (UPF0700 family)